MATIPDSPLMEPTQLGSKLMMRGLVREELERILQSTAFRRSPTLRKLLEFCVTAAPNGNISERQVAEQLLGSEGFDPALDPRVRVQYGRLRRRLRSYYGAEGAANPLRIHVPERSYTPAFEAGSTPPAAGPVALGQAGSPPQSSRAPHSRQAEKESTVPSLAVLPFLNLTNDPERDVFCIGLTEELISALTSASAIHVVARGSSFQFQKEPVDVRTVGRELGVDLILEGSVKMESDRTRVMAQLANVEDGFALWADAYSADEIAGRPSLSQQELASQIAKSLPI